MVEIQAGVVRPVEAMKEGWELIKQDYWIFFAIALVGLLIGGITMNILAGAMLCGIFYCYLQKYDGQPLVFDNLWKGFQWWLPALMAMIIMIVPMFIMMGFLYAPFIAAMVMGSKLSESEMMALIFGALAIDLVFVVLMVCFHSLLMFTFPLIVDRNMGVIEAMKTSAKGVWKNLGGIAGFYGVSLILYFAGVLLCGIGAYFVIPVILGGTVVAYRKIFPKNRRFQEPPAPGYYQGFQG
jgi:flagellar biosynthesis protein FlhB